jgi:hypothetical protein
MLLLVAFETGAWDQRRREPAACDPRVLRRHVGVCHAFVRFVLAEDERQDRFHFSPLGSDTFREAIAERDRAASPTASSSAGDGALYTPRRRAPDGECAWEGSGASSPRPDRRPRRLRDWTYDVSRARAGSCSTGRPTSARSHHHLARKFVEQKRRKDAVPGTTVASTSPTAGRRRAALYAVRKVILDNLDDDFEEGMQYGMIGYYVPHRVYPQGYHCDPKQPLPFASLGSQKGTCRSI